jgi:hypothetical protein
MPQDIIITPTTGAIQFKENAGTVMANIQLDGSNVLNITGNLSLGDTAANVFIGDGTSVVDVIFEQNGAIRALSAKTLTLGQSDSLISFAANISSNANIAGNVTCGNILGNGQSLANVTNRANTAYNIVKQTTANLDNVSLRVASNGLPQISVVTSNISIFLSSFAILTGGNASSTNTGGVANIGLWTNIGASVIATGGDTVTTVIQDQTAGKVYRGTFLQTAGAGNATVIIERLM